MGPVTRYDIRTYGELEGEDRSDLAGQIGEQQRRVALRMAGVDRVVAVMSGKGGVGKSMVAGALAGAWAGSGRRAGLLDADLDSPTGARMLGVDDAGLELGEDGVRPAATSSGVRLMSTALLLGDDGHLRWEGPEEESWVWRGAQERGVLREFLSDVDWGPLDDLVVDLPPGASRFEQLAGLVPDLAGAVAVTLPSRTSGASVRRSMELARDAGVRLLGVVENMSRYACPGCGSLGDLFPGAAGPELARAFDVPLLGRVSFDPEAATAADEGRLEHLLAGTRAGTELRRIAGALDEGESS